MTIASAIAVIFARNPVHSVLWLIVAFFNAAGLMLIVGAEFIAMLLVIVYVGAVAVLFLFVVMMLDVDFAELKAEMARYMPLALLIGVVIIMQLTIAVTGQAGEGWSTDAGATERISDRMLANTNTRGIGLVLYDEYFLLFQLAGLILLVAMIGAIVLTLRVRVDVKRQDPLAQMFRDPAKTLELRDPKPGQGLTAMEGARK